MMSVEDKRKSIRIKNSKRGGREREMGEGRKKEIMYTRQGIMPNVESLFKIS